MNRSFNRIYWGLEDCRSLGFVGFVGFRVYRVSSVWGRAVVEH